MTRRFRWLAAVIATFALLGASCGGDTTDPETDDTPDLTTTPTTTATTPPPEPDVTAEGSAFAPAALTETPNDEGQIEIVFENDDPLLHNISVTDGDSPSDAATLYFDGQAITGPDAILSYTFDAPAAGDYLFYCQFHPEMTGTLTVA
jgi:plastocyanin